MSAKLYGGAVAATGVLASLITITFLNCVGATTSSTSTTTLSTASSVDYVTGHEIHNHSISGGENRTYESESPIPAVPTWVFNLNDNTYFKRSGDSRPSYYFPPLEDDGDDESRPGDTGRSNQSSMVTFYFLLGLFLLFSSMFFCWYFAHHESHEALRRQANRLSRRTRRNRGTRLVGQGGTSPYPNAQHISVIMPNEEGYHYDPPPLYSEIFAPPAYDQKNSSYIQPPSYGEIMSSQKSLISNAPSANTEPASASAGEPNANANNNRS